MSFSSSESALADAAYFHTLNARPYFFPVEPSDSRLGGITAHLASLPPEIRWTIFAHAFAGNRVAVTAQAGCYCASDGTGPYRADHRWLLKEAPRGLVRREAQRVFVHTAQWELHCAKAADAFVAKMLALRCLDAVRHVRVNVFDEGPSYWDMRLERLPHLRSVTVAPWQKGWTIDVPALEGADELSDANVLRQLHRVVLDSKDGYAPIKEAWKRRLDRSYNLFFVFPIRFHLPGAGDGPNRWQLKVRNDFVPFLRSRRLHRTRQLRLIPFVFRSGVRISIQASSNGLGRKSIWCRSRRWIEKNRFQPRETTMTTS